MRKSEVAGVVKLIEAEDGYESSEDCAKAIIKWLDEDRAKRTGYVGVMEFGKGSVFFYGIGPYPGRRSAERALVGHPAAGEASKMAIIPVVPPEGLVATLREIDAR